MIYDLQKASLSKRLSAYLFDVIVFLVLVTGIAFLLSWITGYDARLDELEAHYVRYENEYGIDFNEVVDYEALPEDVKAKYDAANEAFSSDEAVAKSFSLVVNLTLVIVSLGLLVGYLILEFAIPLILKNGQTLGKKIFGIALMRDDSVKVSPVMMFVRTVIGKYTIETMAPIFLLLFFAMNMDFISLAVILLLFVFEIVLFCRTKTRSFIHDILAYTVAVDMQSQMIFDTKEEMLEYKNRIHAEAANNQSY